MKVLILITITGLFLITAGFKDNQQPKPWPVPEKAAKTPNPYKSSAETISAGKALWSQHCSSCHGKTGLGDGTKAAQSDGSMFYKVSEGREDMPSFKKKLPDAEDIWDLVIYMRTLKKK